MKTSRKHLKYLLVIILTVFFIQACIINSEVTDNVDNNKYSVSEEFYLKFPALDYSEFRLEAVSGSIEIIAVVGLDTVTVEGERIVESESTSDARDHLPLLQVTSEFLDQKLKIKTKQPSNTEGRNYLVHYRVEVPAEWSEQIVQINGNIIISGFQSDLRVENTNGNIMVEKGTGNVIVNSTNGNINLSATTGQIELFTVNGNILSELVNQDNVLCHHQTTNGNIHITISRQISAEFAARTVNGSIAVTNLNLQNIQQSQTSVSGTLGKGDGEVGLEVVNGSIYVTGY